MQMRVSVWEAEETAGPSYTASTWIMQQHGAVLVAVSQYGPDLSTSCQTWLCPRSQLAHSQLDLHIWYTVLHNGLRTFLELHLHERFVNI